MMNEEAYNLYNNILVAADMIENLEDREVIYAAIRAARIANSDGQNPRQVFYKQKHKFPHIKLNMSYKNWDE